MNICRILVYFRSLENHPREFSLPYAKPAPGGAELVVVLSVLIVFLVQMLHVSSLRQHNLWLLVDSGKAVRTLGSVTFGMITECKALGAGFGGCLWSARGWYLYLLHLVVNTYLYLLSLVWRRSRR